MFELKDADFILESTDPFRISFTPSEKNNNVNGTVHGGVLFTFCDDIIGKYVTYIQRKGAAADANIHYYRPAMPGEKLFATLEVRKSGRRLGVYMVKCTDTQDRLIADALFTVAFTDEAAR